MNDQTSSIMQEDTVNFIRNIIETRSVVLFMKGCRAFPQCGFSAQVVNILNAEKIEFFEVDVLSVTNLREEIKKFSNWPTIPQLYVNTTLIGGSDIVKAMHVSGELRANLGLSNTA